MENVEETKETLYDRAIDLREAGKSDEAISEMERLAAQYPDYPLAHLALAVFYSKSERFAESVDEAKKACELEPENPFYFTAASSLAIRGGDRETAESALMKAQEARFAAQLKRMQEESNDPQKSGE